MAFRIETKLEGYEFRAIREGKVEDTKWMHLVVEHPETCDQSRVSVPGDMQEQVLSLGLSKGDMLDLIVMAEGGNQYSRLRLVKILRVYDEEGEVKF